MIEELRAEIFDLIKSTGIDFVYYDQGATDLLPSCVFTFFSAPITRDTGGEFREFYLQFTVYGSSAGYVESKSLEIIEKLTQEQNFNLTDFFIENAIALSYIIAKKNEDKSWRAGGEIKLLLVEK
jgi:hypothetical protein